jgi:diaminopimelate decarboxylase
MNLPDNITINSKGHLEIGQCDIVDLARVHGTPLYIFDEAALRKRCREYHQAFSGTYENYKILYAGKAFSTMAICRLMEQEGMGLDVVSGGELYTALAAGFPVGDIYFHGSNKSITELDFALDSNVGRVVVDNHWELETLAGLARDKKMTVDILLRLTPGIEAHTHHYIQTGQIDSKFGIPLEGGQALDIVHKALQMPNISLHGIHTHIGSQIFNIQSFILAVKRVLDFFTDVKKQTGFSFGELNIGGGLAIRYTNSDPFVSISGYVREISRTIKNSCLDYGIPLPKLIIEPGRSLVGEAGIAVYEVGAIKELPNIRTYASIDGGMSDNLRPALYDAKYSAVIANKATLPPSKNYTIAGKSCESGDIIIDDILLPILAPGDLLVTLSSGAYQYSMANNYNRLPRPAVISVNNGKADIMVRRETYQDLIARDRIPGDWE